MKFTNEDKAYLLSLGLAERDIPQVEEAAECTRYKLCDEDGKDYIRNMSRTEAMERLGRNGWLSGLCRSAYHRTAMRQTEDNKNYVLLDSSRLFK